jgi:thiosulfate/3-mercaptopyruvate sulfurtransferase
MTFTTLLEPETLAARIEDSTLAIVDCRFSLDDVGWGEREYRTSHIPGAVYAHLDRDLSGRKSGANGRHPLPDPRVLCNTLGRLGIDESVQVVVYDQDAGMYASRLWWLLRWLGHNAVALLDGGLARWIDEGGAASAGEECRGTRHFPGAPRTGLLMDVDQVAAVVGDPTWRLVDARAPERFRGETEPLDRVAGHIPHAANYFYRLNLDEQGRFRSAGQLRAQLEPALGGTPADHVICYCGSGVTACHNLLALEYAGLRGAKLYAGSWSEWSSDPARSIETAPAD